MNKRISLAVLLSLFVVSAVFATPKGGYYTSVTVPLEVGKGGAEYTKKGTCSSSSFLGLFAGGNCQVDEIAKANGITKIKYVDKHTSSFWFLTMSEDYIVYGD